MLLGTCREMLCPAYFYHLAAAKNAVYAVVFFLSTHDDAMILGVQSFFAWHVEDADLYSVNFLHWGAPKVWYCVPPSGKARFEQVAASMHPEARRVCKGFLRHKDILISPSVLKQFNVRYHMACFLPTSLTYLN